MCGGKHTGPLPLCRTDSVLTPPPHLFLQLIGSTPEKRWSHLFWFSKAWNSLFRSTGKVSSVSSETAKSLSVFKRGGGVVNLTDPTVSFYLPSFGLGSAFLDALKWRFMGNLWAPGSSEVYGWPIKTLLLIRKLPNSSPLFKPIPQFTSSCLQRLEETPINLPLFPHNSPICLLHSSTTLSKFRSDFAVWWLFFAVKMKISIFIWSNFQTLFFVWITQRDVTCWALEVLILWILLTLDRAALLLFKLSSYLPCRHENQFLLTLLL